MLIFLEEQDNGTRRWKKVFFQIQTDNSQLLFKGPMIDSFRKGKEFISWDNFLRYFVHTSTCQSRIFHQAAVFISHFNVKFSFIVCAAGKPWSLLLPLCTCKSTDWFSYIMTEDIGAFQDGSEKTWDLKFQWLICLARLKPCPQMKLLLFKYSVKTFTFLPS